LYPYVDAWRATADGLGLPAAGATGISTGNGFMALGMTPREASPGPDADQHLTIPPAAGMMAGATGVAPFADLQPFGDRAFDNLDDTATALTAANRLDPVYGAPNYLDFGSGLTDETDPVYGFLEEAESALGLLNGFLGGRYL